MHETKSKSPLGPDGMMSEIERLIELSSDMANPDNEELIADMLQAISFHMESTGHPTELMYDTLKFFEKKIKEALN